MKRNLIIWAVALVLTGVSAYYQRVTGPTYPLSGTVSRGTVSIPYRLERSHGGNSDAPVALIAPDTSVRGTLEWRPYRTTDDWTEVALRRQGDTLRGLIPLQPPAGKLQYRVRLRIGEDSLTVPPDEPAVIRFKGDVPTAVLVVHILLMFAGMLFSTRTGLSAFAGGEDIGALTAATIGLLTAGGLVLGPLVQKYAFSTYWTGWPVGTDLTDNKTVVALAAWVAVAISRRRVRRPAFWALGAALITLAVFMIPHSLLGSELEHNGGKSAGGHQERSVSVLNPVGADECAPDGRGHG